MEDTPAGEAAPGPIRFRAGKKRKAYRQRADDEEAAETTRSPPIASGSGGIPALTATNGPGSNGDDNDDGDDDGEASVAAALRLRNARRARLGGVAFRNTNRPDDDVNGERALVPHDPDGKEAVVSNVADRFTHQTGMLADLNDKHMFVGPRFEASHLSPAHKLIIQDTSSVPTSRQPAATASTSAATAAAPSKQESGHAVMQGHLMEIDLGDAVRDRNVARTERVAQGGSGAEDAGQERRAKKPRLGRDGKPWRPRNRRGSDAIKRDQLVEQVLRETRLDVYELPPDRNSNASGADEDGAADERLAEEFRQQFLEDVAQRKLRKKKLTNQPARPGNEEVLKGPKLGGSRNSRAQMRDLLLKKEKEGKK
ncbi:hypothetical protein FALBO_3170 [Fusarium albosuccineum]|uniref:Uncharacterized protein n=1 Tax=Fusarium albosuccineum TaxID=1237068 RepID=A0A8H4LKQ7_9HYPO|nr:hypothetical protein FALBO_3170 [Fusarium albosuccineum]